MDIFGKKEIERLKREKELLRNRVVDLQDEIAKMRGQSEANGHHVGLWCTGCLNFVRGANPFGPGICILDYPCKDRNGQADAKSYCGLHEG